MIEHIFNHELNILELHLGETLQIEDILDSYVLMRKSNYLPRDLMILIDCRESIIDLKVSELMLTNDAVRRTLAQYNSLKEAIIVDKPLETALASIFQQNNLDHTFYSCNIFSTRDAAVAWLKG